MKLLFVCFVIVLLLFFLFFFKKFNYITAKTIKNDLSTNINLQGKNFKVLIAKTKVDWVRGLSGIKKLDNYDGMLFIFPNKQKRVFWNRNTHLNLKLYWLDDDVIIGISNLPSIEKTKEIRTVSSPGKVNKVVEIVIK